MAPAAPFTTAQMPPLMPAQIPPLLALAAAAAARERGDLEGRDSRRSSWGLSTGSGPGRGVGATVLVALVLALFGVVPCPLNSNSARIGIIGWSLSSGYTKADSLPHRRMMRPGAAAVIEDLGSWLLVLRLLLWLLVLSLLLALRGLRVVSSAAFVGDVSIPRAAPSPPGGVAIASAVAGTTAALADDGELDVVAAEGDAAAFGEGEAAFVAEAALLCGKPRGGGGRAQGCGSGHCGTRARPKASNSTPQAARNGF